MRMTQYVTYFRHQYVAVHILRKANFQRKISDRQKLVQRIFTS